jgi:hypothetical protein
LDELDAELRTLLVVWAVAATFVVVRQWRSNAGVGLVFTYVLTFAAMHWLAPVIYLAPWYLGGRLDYTVEGLRQSTYGLLAFAAGSEIALAILRRLQSDPAASAGTVAIDTRLVNLYLLIGGALYVVVFPLAGRLPSATAIVSTGSTLAVVAVCLKCWNAASMGRRLAFWFWLAATATLPIITVVGQGFLGYGLAAMLTVFAFVASFYRPRWRVVVLGALVAYLGLSVYVTYMRDRRDIRNVVWSGSAMSDRLAQLRNTFSDVEWFNPDDQTHLARVDARLNQDLLIGAAVVYIEGGSADLARGETFAAAVLALIPRAIWPNKPMTAGSGTIVSDYTGFTFAEDTSVGVGQVLEAYINFGEAGVVGLLLVIGALLTAIDRLAYTRLAAGEANRFVLFYLPGLSLLQIGGSLVEITSTAGAGLVVAAIINRVVPVIHPEGTVRGQTPPAEAADPADAGREVPL